MWVCGVSPAAVMPLGGGLVMAHHVVLVLFSAGSLVFFFLRWDSGWPLAPFPSNSLVRLALWLLLLLRSVVAMGLC